MRCEVEHLLVIDDADSEAIEKSDASGNIHGESFHRGEIHNCAPFNIADCQSDFVLPHLPMRLRSAFA